MMVKFYVKIENDHHIYLKVEVEKETDRFYKLTPKKFAGTITSIDMNLSSIENGKSISFPNEPILEADNANEHINFLSETFSLANPKNLKAIIEDQLRGYLDEDNGSKAINFWKTHQSTNAISSAIQKDPIKNTSIDKSIPTDNTSTIPSTSNIGSGSAEESLEEHANDSLEDEVEEQLNNFVPPTQKTKKQGIYRLFDDGALGFAACTESLNFNQSQQLPNDDFEIIGLWHYDPNRKCVSFDRENIPANNALRKGIFSTKEPVEDNKKIFKLNEEQLISIIQKAWEKRNKPQASFGIENNKTTSTDEWAWVRELQQDGWQFNQSSIEPAKIYATPPINEAPVGSFLQIDSEHKNVNVPIHPYDANIANSLITLANRYLNANASSTGQKIVWIYHADPIEAEKLKTAYLNQYPGVQIKITPNYEEFLRRTSPVRANQAQNEQKTSAQDTDRAQRQKSSEPEETAPVVLSSPTSTRR